MHSVFAGVDTTVFTDASQDFSRIRWQEYPLNVGGFNAANATNWTITNPDSDTLRLVLGPVTVTHTSGNINGLCMVIPTPISSFTQPGVSTLSGYRTTCGISVEWDWVTANNKTMLITCGFINVDGSSDIIDPGGTGASSTYRSMRRTAVNNPTDSQSTVQDISVDSTGVKNDSLTISAVSADTIGMKTIMGGGGRTIFTMSYDWKDASYNKQQSNFGDLTGNRGSGAFTLAETWDAGNDKISSANYYFWIGAGGAGGVATSNQIDIKKIRYFVHSLGDWTK